MRTIEEILENYTQKDAQAVKDTVTELTRNGVGRGCFQNFGIVTDLLEVLTNFERMVQEKHD